MAVITSLSTDDDTSEVSDLRARIEQQLIAAAKSGRRRRVPFGELFEHHGKRSSASIGWCEIAKTGKEQSTMSTGNSFNAHHEISDRVRSKFFIDGEWKAPSVSANLDLISPDTEELFSRVPEAHPELQG